MIDSKAYNRFISSFSEFERKIINNFAKELSATQADIYLVMARKAACLIEAFEDMGIVSLNGMVVSERILDMSETFLENFFKNKNVLIIDDTIVSGTTISFTMHKLINYNVKSITIKVLTVNSKWYTKELLDAEYSYAKSKNVDVNIQAYIKLIDADSIKFCYDIVKGLSVMPNLYDFDFPRFTLGKIKSKKAINMFSMHDGWMYYDTATKLQGKHGIFSYTGIPSSVISKKFDNYIGINLSDVATLKIRFLGKANGFEKDIRSDVSTYSIFAFPMIIFDAVKKEEISSLFSRISAHVDVDACNKIFETEKSKLRFLQYYFAIKLMTFWNESTSVLGADQILKKRNFVVERMLFTANGIEIINNILSCESNDLGFEFTAINKSKSNLFVADKTFSKLKVNNDLILKIMLLEPFVDFYNTKELPCRKAVKSFDYSQYEPKKFKLILQKKGIDIERLEKGITFKELANRINYIKEKYDYVTFTSIFLDKMISRGIAVPVLQETTDCVVRAYRHGEDAIFGDAENQMVTVALHDLCEKSGREKLTKIETEKFISLFIKFGIRQGWLDELQDDNQTIRNNQIIISNRHDTFGMRADIVNKNTNNHDDIVDSLFGSHQWFVRYLIDKGYVTTVEGGYKFKGDFPTDLQKGTDSKPDITVFYKTFAEVIKYFDQDEKIKSHDGDSILENNSLEWILTILTSCIYPKDQIDALSTEIYLFKQHWSGFLNYDFKQYSAFKGKKKDKRLAEKKDIENYNNALFAINSGQKKYVAYKDSIPDEIMQELDKIFSDEIYSAELRRIIDLRLHDSTQESSEGLIDNLGHWLVGINFAIRILNFCSLLDRDSYFSEYFIEERALINQRFKDILGLDENILSKEHLYEKLFKQNDYPIKGKKEFFSMLSDMLYYKYRVMKLNRYLRSTQGLLNEVNVLFEKNIVSWDKIGNNVIKIINFLIDRAKNLLYNAAIELEHYEKPMNKKYYQYAISIVPQDNYYDVLKALLFDFAKRANSRNNHNIFLDVYISQKSILLDDFTILFCGENAYQNILSVLKKIKKYLPGLKQLIIFNNLPARCSFRIISQNSELRLAVHDNSVIEIMDKVFEKYSKNDNFLLEIGDVSLLSEIGLRKKDFDRQIELEDDTNIVVAEYMIKHIAKDNIKIGIITALNEEFEAMQNFLWHSRRVNIGARGRGHNYVFGYLPTERGIVSIALCCIDAMGNNEAAIQAQNLLSDMQNAKYVIMTGIAAGAPNVLDVSKHVRLGDVVISDKRGVVQYDLVKLSTNVEHRNVNINTGAKLLEASHELQRALNTLFKENIIKDIYARRPKNDQLHDNLGNVVNHPLDKSRIKNEPKLFIGGIGAANILLKNSKTRDELRDELNLLAFEMEGSGIADATWNSEAEYIIVRGICDYADAFKDDSWHNYAAVVAAVYTKWLIYFLNI